MIMENEQKPKKLNKEDILAVGFILFLTVLMAVSIIFFYSFYSIKQTHVTVIDISTKCLTLTSDCIDTDSTIRILADSTTYKLVDNETWVLNGLEKQTFNYDLFSYRFANYVRLREHSTYMISYTGEQIKIGNLLILPTIVSVDAVYQNWGINDTGYFEFISFEEIERHYCIRNAREMNLSVEDCGGTYNTTMEGL